jgi:hypothetical protein
MVTLPEVSGWGADGADIIVSSDSLQPAESTPSSVASSTLCRVVFAFIDLPRVRLFTIVLLPALPKIREYF